MTGDIDGAVADFAPDFEYVVAAGGLPGFGEVARGREGFRRFVETFWREFDKPNIEVHELIDAGDRVVAWTTMRGRGKHSGAETSLDLWVVWTERNGAVVRAQEFESRAAALEAAGLSE